MAFFKNICCNAVKNNIFDFCFLNKSHNKLETYLKLYFRMKTITFLYKSLVLITALISFQGFSQNLLVNGGFETGGAGTGFQTNYFLPGAAGTSAQRDYNILVDPFTMNTANFAHATDHTTGTGKMMVVDGSGSSGDKIWELLNGSSIGVVSGRTYTFSYWIRSISGTNTAANSANIAINTNGTTSAPVLTSGSATCPIGNPSAWTQVTYTWTATTNNAQIWITDNQTSAVGNDFALDDFSLVACLSPTITCGIRTDNSITFNWVPVAGATGYTVSYQINSGSITTLPTLPSLNLTVNSLNPGDQVIITVLPVGSGCYTSGTQTCFALTPCPVPLVSVTQQPTCANPTGTIVFTSPVNTVLPIPTNLFISQVTDANTGALTLPTLPSLNLTYIEIYNGTGATVNLANYKIKIYNNGSGTVTGTCDFALSGNLLNNDVVVIAVGSAVNLGGVVPDLTFAGCGGVNNNDNIRLATIGDVEFDLWGDTTGTTFTPAGAVGYSYSRNVLAPHPSMLWNPADWTATDWISSTVEDYSNIGTFNYQTANYQYSVISPTYQVSDTFANLAPNTIYNVTIRDIVGGCTSTPIPLTVNPVVTTPPPGVNPITYCQNATAVALTATALAGATLNWYGTNSSGGSASATAPTPLTNGLVGSVVHYYVSQTIAGCESTRADIAVTISNLVPTSPPFLFCDVPDPTILVPHASFDFNNVGQTSFSYSYTIDGGPVITGSLVSPSHYSVIANLGQAVTFTLTWNGVCTPSQTITCYPPCVTPVTPTFTAVAPICSGQALSPLPTTSNNGVTGTWTPALNNTATTTYTFTPSNAGECGTTTTLQIVVNTPTTPTFTAVGPICNGQTISALPTTSNNGIAGTWSPALNNTATTTYTFTPTAGQCAQNTTMQIIVNNNVTPTFTAVGPICTGQTLSPLPTTSNNGIAGTWSPALNNIATTTYTFTPTAGQCATATTLQIVVNGNTITPTFTAVAPICTGQTLAPLPTASTNGITGSWSPAMNNTTTTTYTFTPNVGQCALTKTLQIVVNGNTITPTFTAVAPICNGQTLSPLPTTSNNGITGSWSPALNNTATTTYTFTPNTGQCALTTTLQIVVNPNVTPTFTPVPPVCNGTALSPLPTTSNNGITGTWSPALDNTTTTTYTFTRTAGQCATNQTLTITVLPRVTPTFNPVAPICSGQPLAPLATTSLNGITGTWSPALDNTTTTTYTFAPNVGQCANSTTMQIQVVPQVTPVVNIVQSCNSNSVTVTSPLGANYEYSLDSLPYQSSTVFNNLTPGGHNIVAHQIPVNCLSSPNNFIINPTLNDVIVNSNPPALQICDPNNDGFETFDLTSATNSITAGGPYNVTFHETLVDATVDGTSIPNPSNYLTITPNIQTIFVRVESTVTTCYEIVALDLIVNPTPVATEPDDYELCDYTGATGYETFDLTTAIPQILASLNPLTHAVTFYTSQAAAELGTGNIPNPTSYINGTINTETIYVRVEIIATGCYDIVTLQLIVNPLPNATQPNYPQYSLCDTTGLTGFETFDLASRVNAILLGQTGMEVSFYPSLSDAQGDSNEITNLQYTNAIIYVQTLGIRITNIATGCYVISTIDIRVEPLPTLIPPTQPYTICDDNQDGYSCGFDLLSLEAGMLGGAPGSANYTLTFYETITDAQTGNTTTDIDPTLPYCSINPFVQFLYVRAQDNITGCYSILPIELNADPSPVGPVNLNPITVCDQDSNPQSASTLLDLTQQTAVVLAQQTGVATDYTVTYYTSQLLAQGGTSPIINDTNYFGSNTEIVWVRVEHNTTHCYNIGSFQLEINTPLLLTTPAPLSLCDDDANPNDQHHAFNLTVKNTEINQGTGYTVTYYPSLPDAQNDTNAISAAAALAYVNIPPAVQTLGVVVTTTAGCQSITTLDIRVLSIPTPNTNPSPLAPKCDDNNPGDMMEVFDLTVNEGYIGNGDPNLTFHYYNSQTDALVPQNEITTPTAALVGDVDPAEQSVWIRVENNRIDYQGNHCYVLVEQPLTVNPLPTIVQPLPPYRVCDNNTDGIAVFDLTNPLLAPQILGTITTNQQPADYTISYYLTAAGANPATNTGETPLPNSYTNVTPNAQDIYIRVVNNATGCINGTGVLPLAVEPYATATGPQIFNQCDSYADPYDGVELIDLTTYAPAILNGQNPAVFLVSYYTSLADAQAGTNALTLAQAQAYQTDADVDTIWVKVENSSNLITPVCYAITTIDITVERYPNPVIGTANNVTTICVDFITNEVVRPLTLESGVANPGNYTYQWFEDASITPIPGATGPSYTVNTASPTGATRNYTVTVTSASPLACETTSAAFPVIQSGQAVVPAGTTGYTVTSAFSSSQIITVIIEGYGAPDYQYSLDDGPRQASNIFEGVSLGTHIIHVWDTKGGVAYSCEELIIQEVQIIDYPHYFTPNGDGIHDTWNIVGLDGQPAAKIYIFDRYGKLLKQISSKGLGWDGTFNGHLLPSDDYWFTVDYAEGAVIKQFKAHFAMKR